MPSSLMGSNFSHGKAGKSRGQETPRKCQSPEAVRPPAAGPAPRPAPRLPASAPRTGRRARRRFPAPRPACSLGGSPGPGSCRKRPAFAFVFLLPPAPRFLRGPQSFRSNVRSQTLARELPARPLLKPSAPLAPTAERPAPCGRVSRVREMLRSVWRAKKSTFGRRFLPRSRSASALVVPVRVYLRGASDAETRCPAGHRAARTAGASRVLPSARRARRSWRDHRPPQPPPSAPPQPPPHLPAGP